MTKSIISRMVEHANSMAATPALWYQHHNQWRSLSWSEYLRHCKEFAGALLSDGYEPGDALAILGNNRVEWIIADVATMMIRGVPTGIYQTSTPEQIGYIAGHCETKVLVVESDDQLQKVLSIKAQLPALKRIVTMDQLNQPATNTAGDLVISFVDYCNRGKSNTDAVERRMSEIQTPDLATLIYTSGTTGPPKGVMLTVSNLIETANMAIEMSDGIHPSDCVVSYLPLSHIAEQMFSVHVAIAAGYPIWFCPKLDQIKEVLLAARPTCFLGVPRVWEKFHAALQTKFDEATGIKAVIIHWAQSVGREVGYYKLAHGEPDGLMAIKYRLANKLFFSKLKKQLGLDRLRLAISGAAPISKDILEFFLGCGIEIHEVYGQSEGTGPTTFNQPLPGQTRLGTVGKPIPRAEVKLAEDGEILLRGPNVFAGYYKDPEATASTLIDGWLHSGDIGEFDKDGFLRITDRKKDLIITAGGKNVAPQNIEKLLRNVVGVGQAVVIGDQRKYLVALITLDPVQAPVLAKQHGWPQDLKQLADNGAFRAYIQGEIDKINAHLARYETIKHFTLLPLDFSIEADELTPTQKIKRKVIYARYASQIDAMYPEP